MPKASGAPTRLPLVTKRATTLLSVTAQSSSDALGYNGKGIGNQASWGFGFPSAEYNVTSFWQTSSANWTDKQIGLFLSRHREAPKDDANQANRLSWKDSEVMVG